MVVNVEGLEYVDIVAPSRVPKSQYKSPKVIEFAGERLKGLLVKIKTEGCGHVANSRETPLTGPRSRRYLGEKKEGIYYIVVLTCTVVGWLRDLSFSAGVRAKPTSHLKDSRCPEG